MCILKYANNKNLDYYEYIVYESFQYKIYLETLYEIYLFII